MPSLASARTINSALRPSYRPTAVFVGGTGGIGAAIVQCLSSHLNGDLDVLLVGRNSSSAESILGKLPTPTRDSPRPQREFVKCDATLMRDVGRAAQDIRASADKVNFLILTPGVLTLDGRVETDEGIDRKLAVHYYARWKFIHE
jgi:NAD(P)-dependent dehydrogenase (short-subunit alcohol dehydrogenase family)